MPRERSLSPSLTCGLVACCATFAMMKKVRMAVTGAASEKHSSPAGAARDAKAPTACLAQSWCAPCCTLRGATTQARSPDSASFLELPEAHRRLTSP